MRRSEALGLLSPELVHFELLHPMITMDARKQPVPLAERFAIMDPNGAPSFVGHPPPGALRPDLPPFADEHELRRAGPHATAGRGAERSAMDLDS